MNKLTVQMFKKTEILSAVSIKLAYLTGKSKVPIHPKHLIRTDISLYENLIGKEKVILDMGCGPGQHALLLTPFVKKVVGVDKDVESLKIAKKSALQRGIKNIEFRRGDAERLLGFRARTFDGAILIDILEHVNQRQKLLNELLRVLKKEGIVLVIIPNKNTSWKKEQRKYGLVSFSDPDHKIEYSRYTIVKELERAGLKILEVKPLGFDTPWVGLIDLIGGISIPIYKKLIKWKELQLLRYPKDCIGFKVVAIKR